MNSFLTTFNTDIFLTMNVKIDNLINRLKGFFLSTNVKIDKTNKGETMKPEPLVKRWKVKKRYGKRYIARKDGLVWRISIMLDK